MEYTLVNDNDSTRTFPESRQSAVEDALRYDGRDFELKQDDEANIWLWIKRRDGKLTGCPDRCYGSVDQFFDEFDFEGTGFTLLEGRREAEPNDQPGRGVIDCAAHAKYTVICPDGSQRPETKAERAERRMHQPRGFVR